MGVWKWLAGRFLGTHKPAGQQEEAEEISGPHLDSYVSYGPGHEECAVTFIHREAGIRRKIIDEKGRICAFPGFDMSDPHMKALRDDLPQPVILYASEFSRKPDGSHLFIWQVQPDGRYWADEDGFGMTNDQEIRLYTFLDPNGRFSAPMRVYNIGSRRFYPDPQDG